MMKIVNKNTHKSVLFILYENNELNVLIKCRFMKLLLIKKYIFFFRGRGKKGF